MQDLIEQAAKKLATAKRVVISTGAGVSRESGVPTFRDALEGLWAKYNPQDLANPHAFQANPQLVWDFYWMRRELVEKTKPNPAHYGIAELQQLLPNVLLVTQNVDNHHHNAGSAEVVTLHGNLFAYKCSENCQGSPTSIDLENMDWDRDNDNRARPPLCPYCQKGFTRPDVVWFGEMLPADNLQRAKTAARQCDVMLVVGTSGMVYPAAYLPIDAGGAGAFLIEVNPNPSELTRGMDIYLGAPAGEVMPKLVEAVRKLLNA